MTGWALDDRHIRCGGISLGLLPVILLQEWVAEERLKALRRPDREANVLAWPGSVMPKAVRPEVECSTGLALNSNYKRHYRCLMPLRTQLCCRL